MPCDLARLFGKLAKAVPASEEEAFVFSASTLPVPPEHLVTDRLYIAKGLHGYDAYYLVDQLWWYAHKRTIENWRC